MDSFFNKYNTVSSGMSAQRMRVNIISSNIANANTTRTENGEGPYRRRDVVFKSDVFDSIQKGGSGAHGAKNVGVRVSDIYVDEKTTIKKYEPNHPDADKDGYVAYPNINPVVEMANMIEAQRSYEANANAYASLRAVDTQTIDLLKD